jgi:hypothetical protein
MKTKFLGTRKPTPEEKKKGAEIVFLREDEQGNEILIFGCTIDYSWEQWGAITEVLSDNVKQIEKWRKSKK